MSDISSPSMMIYEQYAEVAKALANPHRLVLIEHLAQCELSVEALAQRAGLSIANTSQHLQLLKRVRIVSSRRDGKRILYRIAGTPALAFFTALQQFADMHNATVREIVASYYNTRDTLEPVSREELMQRLDTGDVTLLDVRPEEEYLSGHIPGAVGIPLDELEKRLLELPKDQEIVAYCRGAHCILSLEAVSFLRSRGYQVRRLESGFLEYPVAQGQ